MRSSADIRSNCPNCGAVVEGRHCVYCGTPVYDKFQAFEGMAGKLAHIWYESDDGHVVCLDLMVTGLNFDFEMESVYDWSGVPVKQIELERTVAIQGSLCQPNAKRWLIDLKADGYLKGES